MVRKYGKHGIESGHTFRAYNSKYHRRYRKDGFIIRRDVYSDAPPVSWDNDSDDDPPQRPCKTWPNNVAISDKSIEESPQRTSAHDVEILDEEWSMCNYVPYSVNKKRRWLITEQLRDDVIAECSRHGIFSDSNNIDASESHAHFELVERCMLLDNNNCVNITTWDHYYPDIYKMSSKGVQSAPRQIFCQADNILKSPGFVNGGPMKVHVEEDEDIGVDNYVRIEVVLPLDCPRTEAQLKPLTLGFDGENYRSEKLKNYRVRERRSLRNMLTDAVDDIPRKLQYTGHVDLREIKRKHTRSGGTKKAKVFDYIAQKLDINRVYTDKRTIRQKRHNEDIVLDIPDQLYEIDDKRARYDAEWPPLGQIQSERPVHNDTHPKTKHDVSSTKDSNSAAEKDTSESEQPEQEEKKEKTPRVTFNREYTDHSRTMATVNVLLQTHMLTPAYLSSTYGEGYIECHCIPRRFLIDISESFKHETPTVTADSASISEHLKTMSWLVFIHDASNDGNSDTAHAYKVCANVYIPTSDTKTRINGISDASMLNIHDLISKSIKSIGADPTLKLSFFDSRNRTLDVTRKQSYLEEIAKWLTTSYLPNESTYIKTLFTEQTNSVNDSFLRMRTRTRSSMFEMHGDSAHLRTPPRFGSVGDEMTVCSICLLIPEYTSGSTALKKCAHIFCNACWRNHIQTSMHTGVYPLRCPEHDCKQLIDIGTLLSFMTITECVRYAKTLHNEAVEMDAMQRWCPNRKCGRVVVRNAPTMATARCLCGHRMCFECSAKPHWPVTCDYYADYVRSGFERQNLVPPQEYIVKFDSHICRVCYKPVTSFEPCITPKCPCNGLVCTACSDYWHISQLVDELEAEEEETIRALKPKPNNKLTSIRRRQNTRSSSRSSRFEKDYVSVTKMLKWASFISQHRVQQHPFRTQKLHAHSKSLCKRIRHHLVRGQTNPRYLDFEIEGEKFNQEADKTEKFLESLIDMYTEVNSVVEHCGVMLDLDPSVGNSKAVLQHCVLKLAHNATVLCSSFREGSFQRADKVLTSLIDIRDLNKQLLGSLLQHVDKRSLYRLDTTKTNSH